MESLTIWHWIIIAILIVLVVCAIWLFSRAITKRRRSGAKAYSRSGFGGWLVLLAFAICASPVFTVIRLLHLKDIAERSDYKFVPIFTGEVGLFLAVLLLQICTVILMMRRSRKFVPLSIATGITLILLITPSFNSNSVISSGSQQSKRVGL